LKRLAKQKKHGLQKAWFTKLLSLQNGIPSHDAFGNVFSLIDTEEFCHCFSRWVDDLRQISKLDIISIDGKCLRQRLDASSNKAAIYMVSA